MRLLDEKFKTHRTRYVLQCSLAACVVCIVLLILNTISDTAIIAALGASSFIAFTMPRVDASQPRFLIGGYLIGTTVGCLCHHLVPLSCFIQLPFDPEHSQAILGAVSVGLAMFLMVITDTEHPPAAGLALAFVLNEWDYFTVIVVLVGIVSISTLKSLLKPLLLNLL